MDIFEPFAGLALVHDAPVLLGMRFLRFQEFFEHHRLRGVPFTRAEYESLPNEITGKVQSVYSYAIANGGYNVPRHTIDRFVAVSVDGLHREEQELLDALNAQPHRVRYVIGAVRGDCATKTHELGHALFALDADYRNTASATVRSVPARARRPVREFLRTIGYHPAVWLDEEHAYCLAGLDILRSYDIPTKPLESAHRRIRRAFDSTLARLSTS